MKKYTIHQAKTQFSKLLREVAHGQEVVILNRKEEVARLVPPRKSPEIEMGFLAGEIRLHADFDDPVPGFPE